MAVFMRDSYTDADRSAAALEIEQAENWKDVAIVGRLDTFLVLKPVEGTNFPLTIEFHVRAAAHDGAALWGVHFDGPAAIAAGPATGAVKYLPYSSFGKEMTGIVVWTSSPCKVGFAEYK